MKDLIPLLRLTRAHAATYWGAMAALLVGSVAFLFIPLHIGRFMASLHLVASGQDKTLSTNAIVAIAILLSIHGVAALIYTFLVSLSSERIINELRERFFEGIIHQRLDKRPQKALGEIASEFSSDMTLIQDGLSITLTDCIRHAVVTIGAFAALFFIDVRMTLIAMLGVAVVAGVFVVFIRRATASMLAIQRYRARVMAFLLEAASNTYIIQAYGRTEYMTVRFTERLKETFARVWRQMLLMAAMNPVCLLLFAAVMAGLAMYGVRELGAAHLTIPNLISYFTFIALLVASVSQVGYLSGRLRQAGMILSKHAEMLATGNGQAVSVTTIRPRRAEGVRRGEPRGFQLRDITFTYPGKNSPALSDVSFSVPPGKVTAVVGESGSGKSTLAAILCGLYSPQRGSVHLTQDSGISVEYDPESPDQEIAIVPQEPFLFAGTILENITFGRESITSAQVERSAEAVRIHDFIMSLPAGYDTQIDEAGKNLSRGQRQRIAIARALVGRPSVIIFDEATASLDVVSERAIKAVVDSLRGSVTFVIIAHQGALLTDVDHLIVVRNGAVQTEGSAAFEHAAGGGVLC